MIMIPFYWRASKPLLGVLNENEMEWCTDVYMEIRETLKSFWHGQ